MLHAILHELQMASGPITTTELGRRLGIQPSALAGMLQFWARKGRLQMDEGTGGLGEMTLCGQSHCLGSCPGPARCPLVAKPLTTYSLKLHSNRLSSSWQAQKR